MNVAGQFRFPLHIDHAFGADIGACGDAGGTAECIVAEFMDGEAVHLADDLAVEIDHQGALFDFVLDPMFGQIRPVAFMCDCRVDISACHKRMTFFLGPVAGFADEVAHETEPQ